MSALHSIYLSHEPSPRLSWRVEQNLASFRNTYPLLPHALYGIESGRQFIRDHFDKAVLEAFDRLVPLAYKSDLLRLCLLYQKGGIYSDICLHHCFPLPPYDENKMYLFRDAPSVAPWIVSTSLIYSPQGNWALMETIHQIVANVEGRHYGATPLCPTGPILFGQMVARYLDLGDMVCGDTIRVNRSSSHSMVYIDHVGEVVASNIKRGAGLSSLGGSQDDYNQHYKMRGIYNNEQGRSVWPLIELQQKGFIKKISPAGSKLEFQVFGPYATLAAGSYRAIYYLDRTSSEVVQNSEVRMDVCADYGNKSIRCTSTKIDFGIGQEISVSVDFTLEDNTSEIETRLFSSNNLVLAKRALMIEFTE
jgi:hypothetical protein